jgi:mono/diheme cytochrome c family protein
MNRPTGRSTTEEINVTHRSSFALFAAAALLAAPVVAQVSDAAIASVAPTSQVEPPLYTVLDGDKVDANTMKGWRTWRAMACERCHGPNQEGLVGPSLVNSLKVLTKEQFKQTLMNGRPEKGMPNFGGVQTVVDNLDNLYAYLKGRSDGAIKPGHLHEIDK